MQIKPPARHRPLSVRYSAGMCLRWIRLLIVCGLALSVPLQGLASAGMRWCHAAQALGQPVLLSASAGQGQPVAAASLASAPMGPCHAMPTEHDGMARNEGAQPQHASDDAVWQHSVHGSADTAADADAQAASHLKTPHSCASCAACGVGATLPSCLPRLPGQPQATQALPAWVSSATVGHISAGLERPPRRFLA